MFTLIHSPLVGAFTWSRVAQEMRRREVPVLVPTLQDTADSIEPYWQQHAESAATALRETPSDTRIILVGHSGAGLLLPAIAEYSPRRVDAYIFVDAGLLFQNASQLDLRRVENREQAREFENELQRGARFPTWTAEDLREIIPDDATREALANDLHPRGLDFFRQTLPVFSFPNAPCAYLQFSNAYDSYARQARLRRWEFQKIDAGHFHMLVDPFAVTETLIFLARAIRVDSR